LIKMGVDAPELSATSAGYFKMFAHIRVRFSSSSDYGIVILHDPPDAIVEQGSIHLAFAS
jgi:hypothetical protein